ncbi:MAG: hypothetical protein V2A71_00830, partial [Candidatus Eisenbacteria bacterium]
MVARTAQSESGSPKMTRKETLDKSALERIKQIQSADLVVGIPSYNNAQTIAHVVRAVSAGLARHFPD